MTRENIEQRQALMLSHRNMLFAYVFDACDKMVGYLPHREFLNLNPCQPEFKVYQRTDQGKLKLKAVSKREMSDFRLATCNTY